MAREDTLNTQILDLQTRVDALKKDKVEPLKQVGNIDRQISKLSSEIGELKAKRKEQSKPKKISDHAVVRYLERKHGFDFEGIRKELLTESVKEAMRMGAEGVKIEGGTLKITGNTVTTFIGKD